MPEVYGMIDLLDRRVRDREFLAADRFTFADALLMATLDPTFRFPEAAEDEAPALHRYYDRHATRPSFVETAATSHAILWAFAIASIVLSLNLLAPWVLSGARRARSGIAVNPEDGARFGVPVSETAPPEVARYLRAHRNAEATICPFLALGVVYILAGGTAPIAIPNFVLFVVARVAHAIVYLRALQPWRTITFAVSLLAIIAPMLATVFQLIRH